jgi:hypothetical protein
MFGDDPEIDRLRARFALLTIEMEPRMKLWEFQTKVGLADTNLRHLLQWFSAATRRSPDKPLPARMRQRLSRVFDLLDAPAPPMASADEFRLALDDARRRLQETKSRGA